MATVPFQLAVDGLGSLRVHSLHGKEALSAAWHFDVVASGASGEEAERVGLGQRATLIIDRGDKPRAFYGVVAAVKVDEVHAVDREVKYVFRIVPRLWLLKRNRKTRIFQNKRVADIVNAVLLESNIAVRWSLIRPCPRRDYCTQYEESDYDFVRRILAEAGIYFYFFSGPPIASSALEVNMATGLAAQIGGAAVGMAAGSAAGGLAGSAIQMAETLVPGDTLVCADDALCYPPVAGDDAATLAASTVASLSASAADLVSGSSIAGAAIAGAVSAVAGSVIAALGSSGALGVTFMPNEHAATSSYDKVTRFGLRNSVRSAGGTFRDYDPDRPLVRLQSVAVSTAPFPPSPMEIAAIAGAIAENAVSAVSVVATETADDPAAAASTANEVSAVATGIANILRVPSEVYDHHSPFLFPQWAFAPDAAPLILRQKRRRASLGDGEGGCHDFSPGHCFELQGHLAPQLDGKYVLTTVTHQGQAAPTSGRSLVYVNTFECAPASMPYPPKRPRRRSVQVALTATVVGPEGEEIHVDEKGRIKVQFHWDRAGKFDDASSCWIRTMQAWGGAAWGHQFIPRVGMEVVVTFEGGDPDKPMVLGCLYNGTHPAAFMLPQHKTRSGIRTRSTPGSDGFNELSFEDAVNREEVFLHAQRDLKEEVRNNHQVNVGRDDNLTVGATMRRDVMADVVERIALNRSTLVGADLQLKVGGDQHTSVTGLHNDRVSKDRVSSIGGTFNLHVEGDMKTTVGTADKPKSFDSFSHGNYLVGAAEAVRISADKKLLFVCGDTSIEMTQEGIRMVGSKLTLEGTTSITVKGNGPAMVLGDDAELISKKVRVIAEKSSLELDQEVKIDGPQIKLNSSGIDKSLSAEEGGVKTKPVDLEFTDEEFKPLANKEWILVAGGAKLEGTTDGDGHLKTDVPEDAESADITIFAEARPEGRQLKYRIQLAALPPPDALPGVKARLRNLGYYWGEPDDVLDDDTRAALRSFQEDHDLEVTGEPSQPTQDKLKELARG